MNKFVVIMAGGVGTRFWPLSREKKPKQFISVDGNKCMLVQTIERVCQVIPPENCFIITNQELLDITQETIKDIIPVSNVIAEPLRKNTATCIAYATLLLKQKYENGVLSFLPADAYIKDNLNYAKALEKGFLAANNTKNIVTIGIPPTFPSSGYGYIQVDVEDNNKDYSKVKAFIEKPDSDKAKKLVTSNEYLWNSGIVLGDMDVLIKQIKLFLPNHYDKLLEAVLKQNTDYFNYYIEKAYQDVENVSFDVGVLEKSKEIYMVKGVFDWDDMGSMDALSKTLEMDLEGNFVHGSFCGLDTSDCVIYSENKLIGTIGLHNLVVACTKDAIVICPRDRVQEIKSLVNELKEKGYEDYI